MTGQEQMHRIGLNSEFKNLPPVLLHHLFDQPLQSIMDGPYQNRRPTLAAAGDMLYHPMHAVLLRLLFHSGSILHADRVSKDVLPLPYPP